MDQFLKGKKTYLVAAALAFSIFAYNMGWIDKEMLDEFYVLLTGAGFAALRSAIK